MSHNPHKRPIMYPYHNKIKQRIKNGELIRYEYVERYKDISPCLLLYFSTEPHVRPVREHRFDEYETIFSQADPHGEKKK